MPYYFPDYDERVAQKEAKRRRAEALADMAFVLELPEGQRVMARILKDQGFGRAIDASELPMRNSALALLEFIKSANPKAALEIAKIVLGLKI